MKMMMKMAVAALVVVNLSSASMADNNLDAERMQAFKGSLSAVLAKKGLTPSLMAPQVNVFVFLGADASLDCSSPEWTLSGDDFAGQPFSFMVFQNNATKKMTGVLVYTARLNGSQSTFGDFMAANAIVSKDEIVAANQQLLQAAQKP